MKKVAAALLASAMMAAPAMAEEQGSGIFDWPGITGDWGGARQQMEDSGFTFEAVYTGEFAKNFTANNVTGNGQKHTVYQTNIDVSLTIDTEKAGMWPGGTLFVYGLANSGTDPTTFSGDLQAYSNIEAPNQVIVQEAWYQQEFADGAFSALVGLHDLNSEFYASEYGSLFLNSSFGIGPELSGNVPVSLFPKAGLGARIRIQPTENTYIQAAIYDGDTSTRKLAAAEGKLAIGEIGCTTDTGAYKFGYWKHTANKTFGATTYSSDYGAYGVIDQQLFESESGMAVGVFGQYGFAPKSRNEIYRYIGAGLHVSGMIPTRGDDEFGIGLARADFHATPTAAKVSETAYEVTYRLAVTPWLAIQPSLQWISNAGGDPLSPTVRTGQLRFEVAL